LIQYGSIRQRRGRGTGAETRGRDTRGDGLRAAGIEGIESPYVMRHTFALICYHNDVSIKKISEMMGHRNEKISVTVYVHLFNSDTVDTNSELDDIWGSAA
jgi:integrase